MYTLIYSAGFAIFLFSHPRIYKHYRRWKWRREFTKQKQQLDKVFEETLQRERKRKLHEIDKKKYPLFHWKESTDGSR